MTRRGKNIKHLQGWGLARVSTATQASVVHGSLEQQQHMIRRWAVNLSTATGTHYEICEIKVEDVSGRESIDRRSSLIELQRAIRSQSIDFFVIEKLDRLSRDMGLNQRILQLAEEHGVEAWEVESGRIDLKDRGSRLGFNIKNLLAQEYSLDLQEKITKKQREARVNNGKDTSTWPVIGLDPHPTKTGMYTINVAEQAVIVDIFEQFCKLGSLKALEAFCQEKGYRTKARMTKSTTDKEGNRIPPRCVGDVPFDSKNLVYHLKNTKYLGYSFFKDSWNQFPNLQDHEGLVRWNYAHGAVVPEDLFIRANAILKQNEAKQEKTQKNGNVYLLSGILKASDGTRYSGAAPKSGAYRYYENKQNKIRIPADHIEKIILGRVRDYLSVSGLLEKILKKALDNGPDDLPAIDQEIARLRTRLTEEKQVVEGFGTALRSAAVEKPTQVAAVCEALLAQKNAAEKAVPALEAQIDALIRKKSALATEFQEKTVADHVKKILKDLVGSTNSQKKQIVQTIIPEIVYFAEEKRLQIQLNPHPQAVTARRTGVQELSKWRDGRDLNPRPPA